jgi:hypothetical protein
VRRWLFDGARIEVGQVPIEAPAPPSVQAWVKVSGTWREATPWVKVAGTWRQATPKLKVAGTWQ